MTSQSIPLTILTGFLGAGKTTLLNRILTGDHGLRIAVLVNDFGSINIDADLVVGVEAGGDVISLANGCVCCNIRDDLLAAVQQVIVRPEQPEYIVLEASGVAEPSGIALTFMDEGLRDRIRLDSILCVIDAEQVFAAPETMELKLRQIAFADMVILNKADLVSREEVTRIHEWLDERFHRYRLVEATRADVPLEILLSSGRFDPTQLDHELSHHHDCENAHCEHHHDKDISTGGNRENGGMAPAESPLAPVPSQNHSQAFSTWSYETDQPLSLEALREAARKLPASIYRCKGVVFTADEPSHRAVLQVVGKRVDISLEDQWGTRKPHTQIVAIGAHGTLDGDALRAQFERCVVELPPGVTTSHLRGPELVPRP